MNENLNNNYEPTKNNNGVKILLVILIILVLAFLLLLGYKTFIQDKKENKTYEKINYYIKEDNELKTLYINEKKVEIGETIEINVEEFKDLLIVEYISSPVFSYGVVYVTKDGISHKFDYFNHPYGNKLPNNNLLDNYKITSDTIEFVVNRSDGFDNSTGWMCYNNEIAEYTISFKYLGNEKFDNGKIIKEISVKEKFPNAEGCDTTNTKVSENNSTVKNDVDSSKNNVPIEDTFALQVENFVDNTTLYYYILKDGQVYGFTKGIKADISGYTFYSSEVKNEFLSDAVNENVNLREIKGLPTIKRIKGMVSVATDPSMGILLVAENGEVYIYTISGGNAGDIKKAQFLDDYKVDDVISYYAVPGCTGGVGIKTCGGEYNIIDKEGKSHHYRVNQDGTLTKK